MIFIKLLDKLDSPSTYFYEIIIPGKSKYYLRLSEEQCFAQRCMINDLVEKMAIEYAEDCGVSAKGILFV